jgi:hypothetical protein
MCRERRYSKTRDNQHIKPSMLTTDRIPLDCLSMAKRRQALKTQSRECLQVDAHFLKDHTIDTGIQEMKCLKNEVLQMAKI